MTARLDLEPALDLRVFLDRLKASGDLRTVQGAHWDLEIGAITEIFAEQREPPALLFEDIPEHPRGYRVLSNILNSRRREALALGLSPDLRGVELVRSIKDTLHNLKNIPPKELEDGPVMQNVVTGNDVNVLKFPTPKWHERDGGRYIGTYDAVICQDRIMDTSMLEPTAFRCTTSEPSACSLFRANTVTSLQRNTGPTESRARF